MAFAMRTPLNPVVASCRHLCATRYAHTFSTSLRLGADEGFPIIAAAQEAPKPPDKAVRGRRRGQKGAKGDGPSERKKKIRPNYFVAVQITNDEIKKRVEEIQEMILADYPKQKANIIPLSKLHLTLLVCRLDSEDDLSRASSALLDVGKKMALEPEPFRISLTGMGNFATRVIFAKIADGVDALLDLGTETRRSFTESAVHITDSRPLSPHITLSKSRSAWSKIPKECLERHVNEHVHFGWETVRSLQLCEMHCPEGSDYYRIHSEVDLQTGRFVAT